ncbi:zinc-binding metallopeptidase [Plebeiibacterium sediminum]|uniref:Zinc-binding metallopeptidase n=1 Tax=Plebeiibacterium sediminum TaxID=2992112 RepID=A0AAE3SES4_9BACT|nr:putative zinc-binding metallopeptidase [Plebeiobacterium sediminum]MCW3786793.1 putative zinc-binding metallopeptidase [Plebeiobacterium sediminum]
MINISKSIKWLAILAFVFILGACSKDEEPDTGKTVITIDDSQKNEFDNYLEKVFTDPYNIQVLYKMEDIESDMDYQLVPALYENSIKTANLVKYLCLDAYDEVAPQGFLQQYFPKMIMLVGSAAYRNNGTMVLGTAEGGLKITLYNINELDVSNIEYLYEYYFRTIFHEFSHILHQTIDYTTDFDRISATEYVGGEWNEAWAEGESLQNGFISDYSSKEANEDFVELIAHYITNSEETWNAKLDEAGDEGKAILNEKIAIVTSYLEQSWDIDIDELRNAIQTRAENLDRIDLDSIIIE